ncbi:MAG: VOC family protein [Sandaracinaceae bacterium]
MFARYSLRTTDLDPALTFYRDAVGLALPNGSSPETCLEAWPLHERALAAGAPAHWLGQLEVDGLEASVARMVELGAQPLGPTVRAPDGRSWATLRDPFGAVVALCERGSATPDQPVAWHQLHTRDLDRAWPTYLELARFTDAGSIDVPDPEGGHRLFAWAAGEDPVGSVANTARWDGVHAQWLYYFPVADLDARVAKVRERGGSSFEPIALPSGDRLAACQDPQGAAFGLIERANAAR